MLRHLKCYPQGAHCALLDTGQVWPHHQQRLRIQPLRKPFITLYSQHFIEVYHFIF